MTLLEKSVLNWDIKYGFRDNNGSLTDKGIIREAADKKHAEIMATKGIAYFHDMNGRMLIERGEIESSRKDHGMNNERNEDV